MRPDPSHCRLCTLRGDIVVEGVGPALGRPCRPGRLLRCRGSSHSRDQARLIRLQQGMRWPGWHRRGLLQPRADVPVRPGHQLLLCLLRVLLGLRLLRLRLALRLRRCRRRLRSACGWTVIVQLDVKLVILQPQPHLVSLTFNVR